MQSKTVILQFALGTPSCVDLILYCWGWMRKSSLLNANITCLHISIKKASIYQHRLFLQVQTHPNSASMACHFLVVTLSGQMLHLLSLSQRRILKHWTSRGHLQELNSRYVSELYFNMHDSFYFCVVISLLSQL